MTIASDLTLLANTKTAIKNAIESKGVVVGAVPFNQYPDKISQISQSNNAWTQEKYNSTFTSIPIWTKPSSWLNIPELNMTDEKFCGIYKVYPGVGSFCSIQCAGDYTVDWGDGTVENFAANVQANHTYDFQNTILSANLLESGEKMAIVTVVPQTGAQLTTVNLQVQHPNIKLVPVSTSDSNPQSVSNSNLFEASWLDISVGGPFLSTLNIGRPNATTSVPWGRMYELKRVRVSNFAHNNSTTGLFRNLPAVEKVEFKFDTSTVSNFSWMFAECPRLASIPFFDMSSGMDMMCMFRSNAFTTIPQFNTSNVTNMSMAFVNCSNFTILPLLDTGKVTTFASTFSNCGLLKFVPLFNMASATTAFQMFAMCRDLIQVPNFNTSALINASSMFSSCSRLKYLPPLDLSSATDLTNFLNQCTQLAEIPLLNTPNVTLFPNAFAGCAAITSAPLLNTSSATNMSGMFSSCILLTQVPLFNTSNVTNTGYMFSGCSSLKTVPLFDMSKNTSMGYMFANCYELQYVPAFNTSAVKNMSGTFSGCYLLNSIPLLNTSAVTSATNIFGTGTNIRYIPALDLTALTDFTISYNHRNLRKILAKFKSSVSIANSNLGAAELNEFFSAQPTVTGKTITISGNPGAATCDRTLATSKGWTVSG